jgi:hypothetical protein
MALLTSFFLANFPAVLFSAFVVYIIHTIHVCYRKDLRNIPGPFLARFTNLYRLWHTVFSETTEFIPSLHRRYGRFVRYGPNMVLVGDPEAIGEIYGVGKGFGKVRVLLWGLAEL